MFLHMYTSAYQAGNHWFCFRKEEETEPKPVESSSGKVFMRKPPNKPPMSSCIPVIIEPTDEGAYQLPAWPYPLDYPLLKLLLFPFLDPAKAAANAQLKSWTGNLLKKYGLRWKDKTE